MLFKNWSSAHQKRRGAATSRVSHNTRKTPNKFRSLVSRKRREFENPQPLQCLVAPNNSPPPVLAIFPAKPAANLRLCTLRWSALAVFWDAIRAEVSEESLICSNLWDLYENVMVCLNTLLFEQFRAPPKVLRSRFLGASQIGPQGGFSSSPLRS